MNRKQLIAAVIKYLSKRNLLWLGFRGADASTLLQIPQFSGIFSLTAPLDGESKVPEVCLEDLQRRRVDLHTFDFAQNDSEEVRTLHRLLFTALNKPSVVLMYRPDKFFASAYFPQSDHIEYPGLFHEQQAAFENKTWVESELKKYGIRILPWNYYGQYNKPDFSQLLKQGPFVVRTGSPTCNRGGANMFIGRDQMEIPLHRHDALYALSNYLGPNIPLNVNACVFQDGTISLHGPSLQLIGISSCTGFPLGYCGNDFSQIRYLDDNILDELEKLTGQVGKWLAGKGYLGAFGIDAIEYHNHVYLSEINPRFQGSSNISAQLDDELNRPDIYLNHMASFFGMSAPQYIPLKELARQQREISQIFCYNRNSQSVFGNNTPNKPVDIDITHLPAPDVEVEHEGILFKALVKGSVTTDGFSLLKKYESPVSGVANTFSPKMSE